MPPRRPRTELAIIAQQGSADSPISSSVRQDFTYKKFSDLRLVGTNFRQSLFVGAILQNCNFTSVNFDRCDFAGAKIVNCTFDSCRFVPDEIRSCIISKSTFESCDFGGSQWLRAEVDRTQFEACDFGESSIRESSFAHCLFNSCLLKRSSLTLNSFFRCEFRRVGFSDCTAQFLFFDNCEFHQCRINAETVGFTYGLSERNLDALKLIYLGRRQAKPTQGNLIDSFIENYWGRKWYVGACVLELNFRRSAPVVSLRRLAAALNGVAAQQLPLDWDELRFLVQVLQRLAKEQRLPLLGLWQLAGTLNQIVGSVPLSTLLTNMATADEMVIGQLDRLLLGMLDQLAPILARNKASDTFLLFDVTLSQRPKVELADLIPMNVYEIFGSGRKIELVGSHDGSWIETWQLTLGALVAIQVALVAVNGVIGQLIKATERARRLAQVALPKSSRAAAKQSKAIRTPRGKTGKTQHSLSKTVARQIEAAHLRTEALSPDALVRLDATLKVLGLLHDREFSAFQAYAIDQLKSAQVRTIPASSTKRSGRERRPSA
jgi:uncharacterized protein YjbI with pentapeptide repeats